MTRYDEFYDQHCGCISCIRSNTCNFCQTLLFYKTCVKSGGKNCNNFQTIVDLYSSHRGHLKIWKRSSQKNQSCASMCMPQKCSNWIFHLPMMKLLRTFVKNSQQDFEMTLCFSVTRNGKIAALLIYVVLVVLLPHVVYVRDDSVSSSWRPPSACGVGGDSPVPVKSIPLWIIQASWCGGFNRRQFFKLKHIM